MGSLVSLHVSYCVLSALAVRAHPSAGDGLSVCASAGTPAADAFPRIERGDGEPVVLIPGMFGQPSNWQHQLEHLSDGYRVITLDLPLFDPSFTECSVHGLGDYVRRFLDWAGIARAVLVGNSLGGHVALDVATRHPSRVRAMVLAGSSGLFERGFERGVPTKPDRAWIENRIREVFCHESSIPAGQGDEIERIVQSRANKLRILQWAKSAKRTHMGQSLSQIAAPTLLVWGKQDHITPLDVAVEFLRGIHHSDLVLLNECGHAPMMEHPARFTEILRHFLHHHVPAACAP